MQHSLTRMNINRVSQHEIEGLVADKWKEGQMAPNEERGSQEERMRRKEPLNNYKRYIIAPSGVRVDNISR